MRLGHLHVARVVVPIGRGAEGPVHALEAVRMYNQLVETATPPPTALYVVSPFEHDIVPFEREFKRLRPGVPIYKRFNMGMQ